ncbi:MAG: hypothetical protein AAF938_16130 [Myxococcota bacterium]
MKARILVVLVSLVGCDSSGSTGDVDMGVPDGAITPDASSDGATPDGGVVGDEERPATLSPLACQADLEVLREEGSEFRDHPLEYKGETYGIRLDGSDRVLQALVAGTVLVRTDQTVPGFDDQMLSFPVGETEIAVAPDWGPDNSPEFPVAFNAFMSGTGRVLFRMDRDGNLAKVIAVGDALSLGAIGGEVAGFEQVRVSPDGAVVFAVFFRESRDRHLIQQRTPSSPFELLVATGMALDDTHSVASIEGHDYAEGILVRVGVRADAAQIGFAYLRPAPGGGQQCVMSDTIDCRGGIALGPSPRIDLEDFTSDGIVTAAVDRTNGSSPTLRYRIGSVEGTIERGVATAGLVFNNFKLPRACSRDGTLRFVGQLDADTTPHDELMQLDADGTLIQLTNFGAFIGAEALEGEVPDEILGLALGYGCDAVLRATGSPRAGSTAPYEGYWIAYFNGDTVEAIEETPGREDNGNGPVTNISRGRSGIDPNAAWNTPANIGPAGEFTFLAQRPEGTQSVYARATEPLNRCRAPNVVNSEGDAPDMAPGDGRCDTGAMVSDDPECTFRAMIEETNAIAGADVGRVEGSLTIALTSPLPAITSALLIEGNDVLLDGGNLTDGNGLRIQARNVEVRRVRLENFPADGITAGAFVTLQNTWSRNNCGWGAVLEAGGIIEGEPDNPAQFERNGGDECENETAGGIFQGGDEPLRLTHVRANQNGGPGVASEGPISTTGLEASDNGGDGILVDLDGNGTRALFSAFGTVRASNNRGHGLALYGGGIRTELANVIADANCGFGLAVEDAPADLYSQFGRSAEMAHRFSNNGSDQAEPGGRFFQINGGRAEPASRSCGGGGISIVGLEADGPDTRSRIDSAEIDDNDGPGIASTGPWLLGDVQVRRNFGPGVLIAAPADEDEAAGTMVQFDAGRSESLIEDNFSHGLELRFGDLRAAGNVVLNRNVGAGARLDAGSANLNVGANGTRTAVTGSGRADLMCLHWEPADGLWQREDRDCGVTGGIVVAAGNIDAAGIVARDNAGPGLSASDPDDEGLGIITLTGGEVCENDEPDVARVMNYTDVTTACR